MHSANPAIYGFAAPLLEGGTLQLEQFRGQVLLIVNTASECGFTPQYGELEDLHQRFHARGFTVLAFPCNQFGGQEPGSSSQIAQFCQRNYGVTFPVFAKVDVNGPGAHPLYRYLKHQAPGVLGLFTGGRIAWNFTKFLCSRSGRVVARFAPSTRPAKLAARIESLLDSPA